MTYLCIVCITEQLKATDQLEWGAGVRWTPLPKGRSADRAVRRNRRMNSIRNRAEGTHHSQSVHHAAPPGD
ncbi:MAG: hypothetical protein J5852_09715 [Clostridia bacterium]|nr:hypothetical protein [Clostridia bacterium]